MILNFSNALIVPVLSFLRNKDMGSTSECVQGAIDLESMLMWFRMLI